ncbi:uncharacterized protein LOC118506761 [Anopheles stephensi]|uniref:uncharacterized protein LOC118506761 n=1 Tax=Anopheles stephensi TaxID=30069 RepID=UPI001658914E|nr:uncharacterized protein LOC118506761 [Anopheles stephensi]
MALLENVQLFEFVAHSTENLDVDVGPGPTPTKTGRCSKQKTPPVEKCGRKVFIDKHSSRSPGSSEARDTGRCVRTLLSAWQTSKQKAKGLYGSAPSPGKVRWDGAAVRRGACVNIRNHVFFSAMVVSDLLRKCFDGYGGDGWLVRISAGA